MGIRARHTDQALRITQPAQPTGSRWLSLMVLCAGFLMIVVDMTIVNVALPSIRRDLGFSHAGLAWVVSAYLIAYVGLLLLGGRLAALMLGVYTIVESAFYGLGSLHTLGFGAIALALMVAFLVRQVVARNPILPLRLFRSRNLSGANVIQALMTVGMFGMFFLGSLDLERVLHYRPLAIGLAFLPVAVAMGALSIGVSARLVMRFCARTVLLSGQVLIAAALVLLALGPMNSDYLRDWSLPLLLLGVGGGLAFPALAILAMADATASDSGLASGLLNTSAQIGGALGLAVLATLSTNRTAELLLKGQTTVAALSGGYHLASAVGAALV